jgi:hypothetical protein
LTQIAAVKNSFAFMVNIGETVKLSAFTSAKINGNACLSSHCFKFGCGYLPIIIKQAIDPFSQFFFVEFPDALIKFKLHFQVPESGFGIKSACFDGYADRVAVRIQ